MKQVNIRIPFRILTLVMGLFLSLGAYAQITVNGLVKDATGECSCRWHTDGYSYRL